VIFPFSHTELLPPALAVGALIMVIVFDEVALLHPAFIAERVRVTVPAAISAALGVYDGVRVAPLVNVPVPDVDHVTDV
jgi:hypothetical protein